MSDMDGGVSIDSISEGLTEFYGETYPTWDDLTIESVVDMTSGWETELYGFTLEYSEDCLRVSKRLVARLYSGRHAAGKAKKEFTVLGRLGEAGYPVPAVHEVEADAHVLGSPFMIMDRIEGHSMMDDFLGTPIDELGPHLEAFAKLFVDLHRVDPARVYPESPCFDDTSSYLEMALGRIARDLDERGPPWLRPVIGWLDEHRHGVSPGRCTVLHGDFHPGNVMARPDGSYVVIDWGASGLGDPREDLIWTVLLASAFWERPFGETILEAYQGAAGEEVTDAGFFEVTAIYRRIHDTSISFLNGAEEASMRVGAVEQMKEGIAHLHSVHAFLKERTGIRLPEFDDLLRSVGG